MMLGTMKQVREQIKSRLMTDVNSYVMHTCNSLDLYLYVRGATKDSILLELMRVRTILRRRFGEGQWIT